MIFMIQQGHYTIIWEHEQAGNRRNSSPTLEVGVFLLKDDKIFLLYRCNLYSSDKVKYDTM